MAATHAPTTVHATSNESDRAMAPPNVIQSALPTPVYVEPPPTVSIPPIPEGIVPLPVVQFRGRLPRREELAIMGKAMSDIARFSDYDQVFGRTAPSHAAAEQTLGAAYRWSALRAKVAAFESYCRMQEALAWAQARPLMDKLGPALTLALTADSGLGTSYPSLVRLFGARREIARRGVVSRKANEVEIKEGRDPFKGRAGKRRKIAAAKAALAAREGAAGTSGGTGAGDSAAAAAVSVAAGAPAAAPVVPPPVGR
jgi:hypothetical protein